MNWNLENLTYDQLDIITDRFILADKVTANEDLTGLGFNETVKKTIIDQVKNVNGKILVINDLGFHITKGLLEKGAEKVYLLMTQFITVNKPKLKKNGEYSYRKNGEISTTEELALDDKKLYNLYKHLPIIRDNDKVVLITAEEFYSMGTEENKFDLIIANPPYNMGNKITKNIIDNINFDEFINLMPSTQYGELLQHVTTIEPVADEAFNGAVCVPSLSIAKISRKKLNKDSALENLVRLNIFETLSKYVKECRIRFNMKVIKGAQGDKILCLVNDYKHNFFIPTFSYKVYMSGNTYEINVNNNKDPLIAFVEKNNKLKKGHGSTMYTITNLSEIERDNISNYWYSSKLLSLVLPFILKSDLQPFELLPSVDWHRAWTDEEILREYGYTEEEIKEVLDQAKTL